MHSTVLSKKNKWQDHYTRKAKEQGWLARSIFKLQELDAKYHFLHKGDRVLDLGCCPGSWTQYSLKKVGPGGSVVGLDLEQPKSLAGPNFRFVKADILDIDARWLEAQVGIVDIVLSDLAPRTTGIKSTDAMRSAELAQKALEIALRLLKVGGTFVCKVFESQELGNFRAKMSRHFGVVRAVRPKAVRKGSREIYIIGQKRILS